MSFTDNPIKADPINLTGIQVAGLIPPLKGDVARSASRICGLINIALHQAGGHSSGILNAHTEIWSEN